MSSGIRVVASNGKSVLDTDTMVWNVLASFYCAPYANFELAVPLLAYCTQRTYQVHAVNRPPDNQEALLPDILIHLNSVTVIPGNSTALVIILGR